MAHIRDVTAHRLRYAGPVVYFTSPVNISRKPNTFLQGAIYTRPVFREINSSLRHPRCHRVFQNTIERPVKRPVFSLGPVFIGCLGKKKIGIMTSPRRSTIAANDGVTVALSLYACMLAATPACQCVAELSAGRQIDHLGNPPRL